MVRLPALAQDVATTAHAARRIGLERFIGSHGVADDTRRYDGVFGMATRHPHP
jgi:hypothetical protein